MTEHLEHIKSLIDNDARSDIKIYLDNLSETIKGKVFEHFIADLYKGNGWLTEIKGNRNDKGADIIVRHPSEPTKVKFIIQAKNHKGKINKKDTLSELNQFKEEASKLYNCKQYRLISLNGFVEDAYHFEKYNLRLETWEHLVRLLDNYNKGKQEAPEIGLHSHNKTTYQNITNLWKTSKRVAVIQATGTGKSYIIFKAISDFAGKQKILLTPSKVIHNQFKENTDYGWLIDDSVNSFLYQNRDNFSDENIINQKADLIILDEFHRIGAKKWEKKIEKLLEHNPEAYVLGASATPIRYLDGKRDMAEEFFNGVKAAELTLPQAIVKSILPNPTYIAALVSLDEEVENLLINLDKSRLSDEEKENIKKDIIQKQLDWEKSKGVPEILRKHLTLPTLRKFVVFCEGIDHLDKMEIEVEGWFQKAGFRNRKKFRVHSKQTEKENKTIISDFINENSQNITLLFAVDMLNEGMHIESIDGVILLRPTESPIIFYQQIGRCLQVGNSNPLIFDLVNNFSSIKANNFLNDLNEAKERENRDLQEDGVYNDIPEFNVIDETKEIVELLDSISVQLNTWEIWYSLLQAYFDKFGHSSPKHKEKFNDEYIGYWVGEQRRKANKLFPDQIKRLNELEFDWGEERKTGPLDRLQIHRKNVKLLEEYYNHHKICKVPKREPKTEKERKFWSKELSVWFHHNLKPSYLKLYESKPDEFTYEYNGEIIPIIDFLKSINIYETFKKRAVEIAIERLEEEHKNNPSFNAESFEELISQDKDFYKLVVNKIRNYYHGNSFGNNRKVIGKEYFKDGEIEKLESLGWTWYSKEKKTWDDFFSELKEIFDYTGSSYFKQKVNQQLFQWCKTQRINRGHLSPEQIEKLNSVEFLWEIETLKTAKQPKNDKRFENNASQLPNYLDENGEYRFKAKDKVSDWMRKIWVNGTTPERKEILKKYGYDLDKELAKKKNASR
jgi:superfamily II DNA or RNA helicase